MVHNLMDKHKVQHILKEDVIEKNRGCYKCHLRYSFRGLIENLLNLISRLSKKSWGSELDA